MKVQIVAIAVDKVQNFLFEAIHAAVQEKQTNEGTLRSIIGASHTISKGLYDRIGFNDNEDGIFSNEIKQILLKCSGVCIFTTELEENEIQKRLRTLFQDYYIQFHGQLLLKYACYQRNIESDHDRIAAIKKGKNFLKSGKCLSQIIQENASVLFRCQKSMDYFFEKDKLEQESCFISDINKLLEKQDNENQPKHFRIAVIKADVDGMGKLFESIESFEQYTQVSDILSKYISLEGLAYAVKEAKLRQFKLFPFYAAGDDIFFAVTIENLCSGISLCKELMGKINEELKQVINRTVSVSIAVEFTFNHEPIRYYYERVQLQLDQFAKQAKNYEMLEKGENDFCAKVCINQMVFYDFGSASVKEDVPYWNHFVHSIKIVKQAQEAGITVRTFLYGLLQKITDTEICKSTVSYANAVFYHLIPSHIYGENKEKGWAELRLIEVLLKPLTVREGKQARLMFEKCQQKELEALIRLLLLFTDERFEITQNKFSEASFDKKNKNEFDTIKRHVFNRTLTYLFERALKGTAQEKRLLRDLFIKKDTYMVLKKGKETNVQIYRVLPISTSMLFRLKKYKTDIEISATLLENMTKKRTVLPLADDEFSSLHKEEAEERALVEFDKEIFLKNANACWTEEYIDSLLVFMQFRQSAIYYRSNYRRK